MRLSFLLPLAGLVVGVLMLVLLLAGRSWLSSSRQDTSGEADRQASAADQSAARPQPSASSGLIQGRVLFQGKPRRSPPEGRTLTDVVVYLTQESAVADATEDTDSGTTDVSQPEPDQRARAVLDQSGMQFFPHVVILPQGGILELRNSDTALHNVNGLAT
ncbi:MAG: hypothetical protein RIK87_22000, partial [Fuerstiella sp.]